MKNDKPLAFDCGRQENDKLCLLIDQITQDCQRLATRCLFAANGSNLSSMDLAQMSDGCEMLCWRLNEARCVLRAWEAKVLRSGEILTAQLFSVDLEDETTIQLLQSNRRLLSRALQNIILLERNLAGMQESYERTLAAMATISTGVILSEDSVA